MRGLPARELLTLPVRMHGIVLGRPVDILLDEAAARVVGLELRCGDGERRFLPFAAGDVVDDAIAVDSSFALLDARDLDYYRARTRRLADLALSEPFVDAEGFVHEALTAA
jgi:hypothetical protein